MHEGGRGKDREEGSVNEVTYQISNELRLRMFNEMTECSSFLPMS